MGSRFDRSDRYPFRVFIPFFKSFTLSSAKAPDLRELGITGEAFDLIPKPDFKSAVAETACRGENDQWSSKGLIHHLEFLENSLPLVVGHTTNLKVHTTLIPC